MPNQALYTESPSNYEQKCCCVLVLDVSGSMQNKPIQELNAGLQDFYQDILGDSNTANKLEIGIIAFNDYIHRVQDPPALVQNFVMPTLTADGTTKLVDGVREGIAMVQARKEWYRKTGQPYYRPWVILITDGAPDAGQDVMGLTQEIKAGVSQKSFHFFAIGVQGADMTMLNQISDPSMAPKELAGLKFGAFFKWLSASMGAITSSVEGQKVQLAPDLAEDWMKGFQI